MSLKILLISHSIFHLLYGSRRICTQVCQGCTFNALTCCLGRQLTRFWNKAVVCVCQCLGLKDLGQFSLLYLNSLLLSHSNPAAHKKKELFSSSLATFLSFPPFLAPLSTFFPVSFSFVLWRERGWCKRMGCGVIQGLGSSADQNPCSVSSACPSALTPPDPPACLQSLTMPSYPHKFWLHPPWPRGWLLPHAGWLTTHGRPTDSI